MIMRRSILAALVGLLLSACGSTPGAPSANNGTELTVFAAASLTDAFTEIARAFHADHPGVTIEFNFAGSQQLRTQLEQGAQADVFASANVKEMNAASQSGLVTSGTPQTFVRNRLIVIVPNDNPGDIEELKDLARPEVTIVLAAANVPVGGYTLTSLEKMNADFGRTFSATMLSNVVSYEDNVKQVVAKVQLGEADAGIVYTSDVTPAVSGQVRVLEIPDQYNIVAEYPIAVLRLAPHPAQAQAFVDYVLSEAGRTILRRWGFITSQ